MKTKNNGFTLIELLVVVAIIGILSSVVLSQLNTARSRGADAAVKSNLNNMRSYAESQFDNGINGFQGVCALGKMTELQNAATAAGGNGGSCNSSPTIWVAWAGLKLTPANAWCVDNTGASKQIVKPVGTITSC